MIELYKPLEIPNLESIQEQLLSYVDAKYLIDKPIAFTCDKSELEDRCPEFIKWICDNSKIDVLHYRVYITPPGSRLSPHIDGGGLKPIVPFRLNVPLSGTKGTKLTFYNTPENNKASSIPDGYLSSIHPIDYTLLKPIDSLELIEPHFINTSILHGVRNPLQSYRIIFAVTWKLDEHKWRNVEDVFNI